MNFTYEINIISLQYRYRVKIETKSSGLKSEVKKKNIIDFSLLVNPLNDSCFFEKNYFDLITEKIESFQKRFYFRIIK